LCYFSTIIIMSKKRDDDKAPLDKNSLVEQIQKVRREADQIKEQIRANRDAMKDTSCMRNF
jgi:hypothetical protein